MSGSLNLNRLDVVINKITFLLFIFYANKIIYFYFCLVFAYIFLICWFFLEYYAQEYISKKLNFQIIYDMLQLRPFVTTFLCKRSFVDILLIFHDSEKITYHFLRPVALNTIQFIKFYTEKIQRIYCLMHT